MKTTAFKIELTRNNVTPAQFLAYVRHYCKKNGVSFDMSLEDFAIKDRETWNISYNFGTPSNKACFSEICKATPYNHQTYIRYFNGEMYNEICEFEFDDETHGHGYFYTVQVFVDGETTIEEERNSMKLLIDYYSRKIDAERRKIEEIKAEIERNGEWAWEGWQRLKEGEIRRAEYDIEHYTEYKKDAEKRLEELNPDEETNTPAEAPQEAADAPETLNPTEDTTGCAMGAEAPQGGAEKHIDTG